MSKFNSLCYHVENPIDYQKLAIHILNNVPAAFTARPQELTIAIDIPEDATDSIEAISDFISNNDLDVVSSKVEASDYIDFPSALNDTAITMEVLKQGGHRTLREHEAQTSKLSDMIANLEADKKDLSGRFRDSEWREKHYREKSDRMKEQIKSIAVLMEAIYED